MLNYFYYQPNSKYPADEYFRPDESYPEYPFMELGISREKNEVYRMMRCLFMELGLDSENFGKSCWNPLKEYIHKGQTVLIKPNLVNDVNSAVKNTKKGMECLVTHPSVIKCIVDYVLIALRGAGRVVIADAPIQDCDFNKLKSASGYTRLEEFYSKTKYNIQVQDLREIVLIHNNRIDLQKKNNKMSYGTKIVNLSSRSYFYELKSNGRLRITNYDSAETNRHHEGKIQEYCVNSISLKADVIINVPKPKTHRLAGYTGALKNFVGINARKEYLPHHRKGSPDRFGDEYPAKDRMKSISSLVDDLKNWAYKKNFSFIAKGLLQLNTHIKRCCSDKTFYGMWYGNDTIWRTILDLNRIINYCDKNGIMQKDIQRKIINIGDMIVCGDREGPLAPSYKDVGGILFSENAVEFDYFLVKLMGYDIMQFPVIKNALRDRMLTLENKKLLLDSNSGQFRGEANDIHNFSFIPAGGWLKLKQERR